MSEDLLKNQIEGLKARLTELRAQKDLFVKAQGLDEAEARAREEISQYEIDHQAAKEKLADLMDRRAEAIKPVIEALSAKMNEILPEGQALFELNGGIFIGWMRPDGERVPYSGLSGGQRVWFDQALCSAMMGDAKLKILIYEAAEADQKRLSALIEKLSVVPDDTQVILNTWFRPEDMPVGWNVVEVQP